MSKTIKNKKVRRFLDKNVSITFERKPQMCRYGQVEAFIKWGEGAGSVTFRLKDSTMESIMQLMEKDHESNFDLFLGLTHKAGARR